MLRSLQAAGRAATAEEQSVLGRWSGWGALPGVFDANDARFADLRGELRNLLSEAEWRAAERTTLNAHYTPLDFARSVWSGVTAMGFTGGRVLEPGCGAGTFLAAAPEHLELAPVGIELDPVTAAVAQALHPHATIRAESFADSRMAEGSFDLTIGNVPFGKISLADSVHNRAGHSIHNHFLVKALWLTRPGGLVAAFTSRFTLDAANPAARREMATLADLVGAIRLPEGAFRAVAGTDTVIDLLVLRRREPDREPAAAAWERTVEADVDGGPVRINEAWLDRPDRVLGRLTRINGQYSESDLTVRADNTSGIGAQLADALGRLVAEATEAGLTFSGGRVERSDVTAPGAGEAVEWQRNGSLLASPDGGFVRVGTSGTEPYQPAPAKDRAELRALIAMRDAVRELLDVQATNAEDGAFEPLRQRLNQTYNAYVARWGPINRHTLVPTGRTDPATGEARYRRAFPRMGGFRDDPDAPAVLALEYYDPDTKTAIKADVFDRRVVAPRATRLGADSPEDALAVCLDAHGSPHLAEIARLLGADPAAARAALGELVYDDPVSGGLVTATSYLSGDVRNKLGAARLAAEHDSRFAVNVAALEAVQPPDLLPTEIDARPGAPWIDPDDVAQFAAEVFGANWAQVEHAPVTATWTVSAGGGARATVAMTSEWGTMRMDALHLLEGACNQRTVTVYDELDDGRRVTNVAETLAAREKHEAICERFGTWIWEDPERAERLAHRYNEKFNATVLPTYDGSHLTFPGLSDAFRPHRHQRDAVWRILSEPTVLLAHAVGAGKTATMVMGGMELRRLGLVSKPAYVVPNHMLEQFSREFLQLYPRARILVASKQDVSPGARKEFVARCATGDWDAIVLTASSFARIPVSAATRSQFIERRIDTLRDAIAESRGEHGLSVKRLQQALVREEERHKRLLADQRKDDGVSFEAAGIDYLFVDESQAHKNLAFPTRIAGVGGEGSQRAEDLALKLGYLRETHGQRIATFATATPIANSVAEMFVVQTYLQPDALAAAGIASFDAWAATFGRTVTALELTPEGGGYRMHSRFARFANVPELLRMFRAVADVRTPEQLDLPVPAVAAGPQTVVVPASDGLRSYVQDLVGRAEAVRNRVVRPEEDNMLKVAGDGRRAALHLALVGETPDPDHGKLTAAAERIAGIYRQTAGETYTGPAGESASRPGALQLVFCDLGTPKADGGWSVYTQMRDMLADRGVPTERIAFIHDANGDKAKADLFAACRDGRVNVLVGSTEKMGVGTNVQARATALHHLDCPWRPADIEQREGRILRQGNQNAEVELHRYVTEGSFDIYMWQTVERKAAFIHQVIRGEVTAREVDDVGDQALSYAEVKALATGNPLILERAGIESELAKLGRLRAIHHADQTRLVRTRDMAERRADAGRATAKACEEAIAQRVDTRGDKFHATIGAQSLTARPDAAEALRREALSATSAVVGAMVKRQQLGTIGGISIDLVARRELGETYLELTVGGVPADPVRLSRGELHALSGAGGLLTRLENRVHDLERRRDDALATAEAADREAAQADERLHRPFPHEGRTATLSARLAEIDTLLAPPETPAAEVPTQRVAADIGL